jgi:hypothetical protein
MNHTLVALLRHKEGGGRGGIAGEVNVMRGGERGGYSIGYGQYTHIKHPQYVWWKNMLQRNWAELVHYTNLFINLFRYVISIHRCTIMLVINAQLITVNEHDNLW